MALYNVDEGKRLVFDFNARFITQFSAQEKKLNISKIGNNIIELYQQMSECLIQNAPDNKKGFKYRRYS